MRREFPVKPVVGVGGVVVRGEHVLLVRRGREPLKGRWSIPGGRLELGEDLAAGVRRELREETGLVVEPIEVLAVFDRIVWQGRRIRFHFVIVDYACRVKGGRLKPASDVLAARWVRRRDLPQYRLTKIATSVIGKAFRFFSYAIGSKAPKPKAPGRR